MLLSPVNWTDEGLQILDQTALPEEVRYRLCTGVEDVADAIRKLQVRGAPAIGIAAAYGMVLSVWNSEFADLGSFLAALKLGAEMLRSTRPTAVNLFWALDKMEHEVIRLAELGPERIKPHLLNLAKEIHQADIEMNRQIGANGAELMVDGANILTHCNTGALATGGHGTALGVVRSAYAKYKNLHVWVDETRPLLQGARLTAWELARDGIPHTVICDSTAATLMAQGKVDAVIVGADRIAANGDTANKIGTYSLAVLAHHHGIPFYVAAPSSTIDMNTPSGEKITIEERSEQEIRMAGSRMVVPQESKVYNPAFDVTPSRYITAIITDKGVVHPPYEKSLSELM